MRSRAASLHLATEPLVVDVLIVPSSRVAAAGRPRPGPEEVAIVGPDGVTSFAALRDALSKGGPAYLVYFVSDLLHLDGVDLTKPPNRLMAVFDQSFWLPSSRALGWRW